MKPATLLLVALVGLSAAGCTGLPEGSADFGDSVTVRYSVHADGQLLRSERTATFVLGSGGSGLGLGFERGLRGHLQGENLSFSVADDPSLRFGEAVTVARDLAPIQQVQDAPRTDFEANVGPAAVGQQFAAFGIYTATVTGFTADTVNFTIDTRTGGVQEDPVASVGAILVSTPDGAQIQRRLDPDVGATFTVAPPAFGGQTPLGLAPGTYRTEGATAEEIQYVMSTSGSADLIGKDLTFTVTVVRLVAGSHDIEPVDGNYVGRPSPYVNGDPESALMAETHSETDEHTH